MAVATMPFDAFSPDVFALFRLAYLSRPRTEIESRPLDQVAAEYRKSIGEAWRQAALIFGDAVAPEGA